MTVTTTPTLQAVYAKVEAFLAAIVPSVSVVLGYTNLVPAPLPGPGFVVFEEIGHHRLNYTVNLPDYTGASPTSAKVLESFDVGLQIDCVGPLAGNWAAAIESLWRNQYGCNALAPVCAPLTADSAPMDPFIGSEANWEKRWRIDAHLQWNAVTTITQLYARSLKLTLVDVIEAYIAGTLQQAA